jgi:acetyl esterase/lipase
MAEQASSSEQAGIRVIKDVAYAPPHPTTSQGHLLDMYLPVRIKLAMPLVIWSHGSGWLAENGREGTELIAAHFNPRGFAVAGIAIRSSSHAQFPKQLYDIKAAIRWLRAHAQQYNLDPDHFGIMGESSGGWTAALAGVTADVPHLEGDVGVQGPSGGMRAAVSFYPPTDFLQMDAHMVEDCIPYNRILGLTHCHADAHSAESLLLGCPIQTCPEVVQQANPISYVSRKAPPFLILHGQKDVVVPYNQSELLYHALSAVGTDVTLVTLPRGGHGHWNEFLIDPTVNEGAFAFASQDGRRNPAQPMNLSWETVIRFFEQHLCGRHQ